MSNPATYESASRSAALLPAQRKRFSFPFLALEIRRILRDPVTLFFTTVMPAFMYIIFGATQEWGAFELGRGNVAMSTMVAMAAFGALVATSSVGGMTAVERSMGWGRQLGLTPMHDATYVLTKCLLAVFVAFVPITIIFILGAFSQASAPGWVWAASYAITAAGSVIFAFYGLLFGLAFRSEAALAASGGSLSILAFLGNVFIPLSGTMLEIARFTPLYGYVAAARYPLTEGWIAGMGGQLVHEPLWWSLANVVAWALILGLGCLILVRRGRGRP